MTTPSAARFNPAPGWPTPPPGWVPPAGWSPDPAWPAPPPGWQLWIVDEPEDALHERSDDEAPVGDSAPGADDHESEPQVIRPDEIEALRVENARLRARLEAHDLRGHSDEFNDAQVLHDVGIYRYHHPLETAAAYQDRLKDIESRVAGAIKDGTAIEASETFTMNNSLAQGRRLSNDLTRLMLRAYNAEVDNSLRTLRAGNVLAARRRVERSRDAIAKLGSLMDMRISEAFHALRLEEIELTADWLMKKQAEREEAREERARLREERRVQRELEAERARLDKERAHILNTLSSLETQGRHDDDLASRLAQIDKAIEDNDFRAANIRAGYIYVISNEGAFGPGVVKIGLTRRLEPLDRITELSGAAVPFRFDVHALFFSEDAVSLELMLHKHFSERALNRANARKEFFFATPAEVRDVLLEQLGNILEFSEEAEALEFRQSEKYWPAAGGSHPAA